MLTTSVVYQIQNERIQQATKHRVSSCSSRLAATGPCVRAIKNKIVRYRQGGRLLEQPKGIQSNGDCGQTWRFYTVFQT
jgi:hypothetical protein